MHYRIRVQGQLDPFWQHRFEGLRLEPQETGTTLLSGTLPDQAALYGVLLQLIRLGLPLLALETSQDQEQAELEKKAQEEGDESPRHPVRWPLTPEDW